LKKNKSKELKEKSKSKDKISKGKNVRDYNNLRKRRDRLMKDNSSELD
jgi:hypothetical protein